MSAAEIANALQRKARDAWPEPNMLLLAADRVSTPLLDDDALPARWEPWVAAEAEARACPRDYIAGGLIGGGSAWIGNSRHVLATADWIEPPQVWFALVGAPSTGKTPALRPIIAMSSRLERDAEPAWREALSRCERDTETANAIDKGWREAIRDAAKGKKPPPNRPATAQAPTQPPRPRELAMDCSTEELQRLLSENSRGLLYVRDELAGWLGGFDRYGGSGSDRAFYLETWNGGAYVCDRVKYHSAPVRIERASLAILGGMVLDRLREVLAEADDGLTARFLYVWPEPVPIRPLAVEHDAEVGRRREMLTTAARRLRALGMGTGDRGEPAPRILRLESDALRLFGELRCDWMRRARSASGLAAGWPGKNPGRALRLALVFELLSWAAEGGPEPLGVSADAVARAGGYLDYAEGMLERVLGGLAIEPAERDATLIARYLLANRPSRMNERDLYQTAGFAWTRKAKRREAAIGVLEREGFLRRSNAIGAGRPRGDWDVSPRLAEIGQ
jgi:hypothetical protein